MKDTNAYEIVQLLHAYKCNKAKIQLYNIQLEGLEELINLSERLHSVESPNDCIEGIALKTNTVSDMPKYNNNQFRSTTEKAALLYQDEMEWTSEDRSALLQKIKDIKSRMYRLDMDVRQVDVMLNVLPKEQRFIIEQYYIEGYRWPEILEQFTLNFNIVYTLNTLYAWRDKALEKMFSVYRKCG